MVCNDKGCEVATKSAPKLNPEDLIVLGDNNTKATNTHIPKGSGLSEESNNNDTVPRKGKTLGNLKFDDLTLSNDTKTAEDGGPKDENKSPIKNPELP
jgi:hypothetical protein